MSFICRKTVTRDLTSWWVKFGTIFRSEEDDVISAAADEHDQVRKWAELESGVRKLKKNQLKSNWNREQRSYVMVKEKNWTVTWSSLEKKASIFIKLN